MSGRWICPETPPCKSCQWDLEEAQAQRRERRLKLVREVAALGACFWLGIVVGARFFGVAS